MDANKQKKLLAVRYKIAPCCHLCKHARLQPSSGWGTCKLHGYEHQKHTDTKREMSIYKFGVCSSFEPDPEKMAELGKFDLFYKDT